MSPGRPADPVGVTLNTQAAAIITQSIGLDSQGRALATWDSSEGLLASRCAAGGAWETPVPLTTEPGPLHSSLAVSPSGAGLATWVGGSPVNPRAAFYTPDTGWGLPTVLEQDDRGSSSATSAALAGDGSALVTWVRYDGTAWNVMARRYSPASGWSAVEPIGVAEVTTNGYLSVGAPQAAISTSGKATVLWEKKVASAQTSLVATIFTPGAGWSETVLDEHGDEGSVGMDDAGRTIVAWQKHVSLDIQVCAVWL